MRHPLPLATFAVLASLSSLPVVASGQEARERPRFVLQALDLDRDGALSASEIQAAPTSLRALDRNGDGELTPDEMEPPRTDAGASPDELVAQLMSFDRNGDGVLTPDELPERMRSLFARGDKNQDGKLTADEIRQTAQHSGSPNGRHAEPGKASGMMRLDPVLNTLDANHDGVLSAAEISAAAAGLLTLDADHDGAVAASEMRVRRQTPAERTTHVLDEFDTNKDGKLSREEVPDGLRSRFAASDKNADGFLDSAELLEMFGTPQPSASDRNATPTQQPDPQLKGQQN